MKITLPLLAAVGLASAADSSGVTMERLMNLKVAQREEYRNQGYLDPGKYNGNNKLHKCRDGRAGEYRCDNVDMHGFLSHEEMGSSTREGNDIWGWTSDDGREFGAVGQTDGTAFVEVMKDGRLEYKGRLPTQTYPISWRDMKVIDGYVYIGSEAEGHGLQVFDMRKLLRLRKPKEFSIHEDMTAWFDGFGSSHNIVAHEETNMIYAVGTQRNLSCAGGLYMVDVSDPSKPTSPGCAADDGYVHDAQCVIYVGPDFKYLNREICFNYNEDTLTIVDVTDKKAPKIISKTDYVGAAYTHQGWVTNDKWMTHLLLDDELDEVEQAGHAANNHTTTYIFDITNLEKPFNTGYYQSPVQSIDHNQYVIDGFTYQANYASGLRIVDISSYWTHPDGSRFEQAGFFDCHPEDDDNGVVKFVGSWGVYPYFKSGHILLNSIERGVYSLKFDQPGRFPWLSD